MTKGGGTLRAREWALVIGHWTLVICLMAERVLVINLKRLGDVLLATPAIHALRAAWPGGRITALVRSGCEAMLAGNADLDAVWTLPGRGGLGVAERVRREAALLRQLRGGRFDLVLEMGKGDREAILGLVSGAPARVGYEPGRAGFAGRRRLLTHAVPWNGHQHMVETYLDLCEAVGVPPADRRLRLAVRPAAEARVASLLEAGGLGSDAPLAVVHPVSRWLFKCWTDEGFAAVCRWLVVERGLRVAVTAGPEPSELAKARRVVALAGVPVLACLGTLTLEELAALLRRARLFVGVDSAPMHMAAAVGARAVALFGPSGEHSWGPWGEGHVVVGRDLWCRPCGRDGCLGSKRSACLEALAPEEVQAAIDVALGHRAALRILPRWGSALSASSGRRPA
jgi:heptosyltransferase-3